MRAVNYKHWENNVDCELLVCIGSEASTRKAKWFLEEEFKIRWMQAAIGKCTKYEAMQSANPNQPREQIVEWLSASNSNPDEQLAIDELRSYADAYKFNVWPEYEQWASFFSDSFYQNAFDYDGNENYKPPVVVTNAELISNSKRFLNVNQKSVKFLLVGKLPDEQKKIILEELKTHRIKEAKIFRIECKPPENIDIKNGYWAKLKDSFNVVTEFLDVTEELKIIYELANDFPENEDDLLNPKAHLDTVDDVVRRLNESWVRVTNNGKNYVVRKGLDNLGRPYMEFFDYKSFAEYFIHEPKIHNGEYDRSSNPILENPAMVWLKDERSIRSEYGVTFYPKNVQFYKGRLNAYYGLGVTPTEYDIEVIKPYLDHIEKIICSGNETYFNYVLNWCAHMLQIPEEKPETAIVLKAEPGTGKGTFVKPLGKIIGSHFLHATDAKHIVGKFNKSMENKILVFGDEFFSGSKEASDKLKGKITEETQTIERKRIDTIETPDYARVILASNHENIVRIEMNDRRYMFLEVSNEVMQNHEYFGQLGALVKDETFCSMLADYLLKRDIRGFNPRVVPKTEGLARQKLDNLEPLDKWLLHCLRAGSFTSQASLEARVSTNKINEYAKRWLDENKFTVYGDLPRKIGKTLKGYAKRTRLRGSGTDRIYVYEFRCLDEMRGLFNRTVGYEIEY